MALKSVTTKKGNYNPDKFKLYFKDTGILIATLDEEARDNLRINKALGIYKNNLNKMKYSSINCSS